MNDLKYIVVTWVGDGGVLSERILPAYQCEIYCRRKYAIADGKKVALVEFIVRHKSYIDGKETNYNITKEVYQKILDSGFVFDARLGKQGEYENHHLSKNQTYEETLPLGAK